MVNMNSIRQTGTIKYTPKTDITGVDVFWYTVENVVTDDKNNSIRLISNEAKVTVTVQLVDMNSLSFISACCVFVEY